MSYFLRAGLIRRIAERGPTVTFTRTIKEWDGTISTVTVRSQMGGDHGIEGIAPTIIGEQDPNPRSLARRQYHKLGVHHDDQ